tara:strand:- start:389 stop:811 length:423 start_codon:yes stop_codon:yes gene_type:complete
MKHYNIDEDTFKAVVEIVNEQYVLSKMAHDRASIEFYSYLLGELESVEDIGEDTPDKPDVDIKLGKLERYLRMLQESLNEHDIDNKRRNKRRRDFANDALNRKGIGYDEMLKSIGLLEMDDYLDELSRQKKNNKNNKNKD